MIKTIIKSKQTDYSNVELKNDDIVYYVRVVPKCGICCVESLKLHTSCDYGGKYFIGITNKRNSFPFSRNLLGKRIFLTEREAIKVMKEIKASGIIKQVTHEEDSDDDE